MIWEGYEFDFAGFDIAKLERWEPIKGSRLWKCKLHNTIFNPGEDPDAEPRWPCHNEFHKKI
jgi:hypothetical protein